MFIGNCNFALLHDYEIQYIREKTMQAVAAQHVPIFLIVKGGEESNKIVAYF